jgi:hypothetical protein
MSACSNHNPTSDDGLTIFHGVKRRYDYLATFFPDLCKTQAILDPSEMRFLEPENNILLQNCFCLGEDHRVVSARTQRISAGICPKLPPRLGCHTRAGHRTGRSSCAVRLAELSAPKRPARSLGMWASPRLPLPCYASVTPAQQQQRTLRTCQHLSLPFVRFRNILEADGRSFPTLMSKIGSHLRNLVVVVVHNSMSKGPDLLTLSHTLACAALILASTALPPVYMLRQARNPQKYPSRVLYLVTEGSIDTINHVPHLLQTPALPWLFLHAADISESTALVAKRSHDPQLQDKVFKLQGHKRPLNESCRTGLSRILLEGAVKKTQTWQQPETHVMRTPGSWAALE